MNRYTRKNEGEEAEEVPDNCGTTSQTPHQKKMALGCQSCVSTVGIFTYSVTKIYQIVEEDETQYTVSSSRSPETRQSSGLNHVTVINGLSSIIGRLGETSKV